MKRDLVYCYDCVFYGNNKSVMEMADLEDLGLDYKCREDTNKVPSWFSPKEIGGYLDYCSEINSDNDCPNYRKIVFEKEVSKKPKKKEVK